MRQGKWGDSTRAGVSGLRVFDKDKIQAGFDITSQFINQAGTFVANRAAEADAAKAAANNPNLTPDQRAAAQQRADELNSNWGPSGTYRQVLTALSVAAGGNVTGGVGQLAQSATVAYLQELCANQVKQIADNLGSEEARVALHAIVGCAGAAASSQSCGAGAMGAASSSVLGSLLAPSANLSATEREARDNLVTSLVAGVAAVSGQNIATAAGAGKIEVENNQVAYPQAPPPPWLSGFKLPGYKGQDRGKDDASIVDNVTELDPSAKAGPLVNPNPLQKAIEAIITTAVPDWLKEAMTDPLTMAGYKPNQGGVGNMGAFLGTPGFGTQLGDASQKTRLQQIDGQSVYKATDNVGTISKGDYFYLDGMHKDHLEVFDSRGKFKAVVNMDGTLNDSKTSAGQGRKINVK